jgi:hypothetical protein
MLILGIILLPTFYLKQTRKSSFNLFKKIKSKNILVSFYKKILILFFFSPFLLVDFLDDSNLAIGFV